MTVENNNAIMNFVPNFMYPVINCSECRVAFRKLNLFKWPQKKKTKGFRSGDLRGRAIEPPRPIQ
jgi:hypothetical protein